MKRSQNGVRVVSRVVKRLRQTYHPTQVILFGGKRFCERLFEVRRLVSPVVRGYPFDPIVITPRELKRRLARGDQFLQEIVTKGKQVYGSRS